MDANSPWLQALRDLWKLRLVVANTMRSALLLSGLVGTLVLSVPAESRPYRKYAGTCERGRDCELGLYCLRGWNKNYETRNFCQVNPREDRDRDGIPDGSETLKRDNCIDTPNPDQDDYDLDGIGDQCEKDIDADGIPNARDNCPFFFNRNQRESDEALAQCSLKLTRDGCVYRHPLFPTGCPVQVPIK